LGYEAINLRATARARDDFCTAPGKFHSAARPIPELEPVTSATLFSKVLSVFDVVFIFSFSGSRDFAVNDRFRL